MKLDDILNILYFNVIININHILKLCDIYTCQHKTCMQFVGIKAWTDHGESTPTSTQSIGWLL
jgi:hypothetical protein